MVVRGVDTTLLAKLLQQQRREGAAVVQLLDASAATPKSGAPEPGKGSLVDVVG